MTRPDHLPPRLTEPVRVSVVGGGPAGLMAAETAALGGAAVTVYERMPSVGRKFLLAGRGGLNITHGEPLDRFLTRYGAAEPRLRPVLERWTPDDLRAWCEALGQPTTVGTSGRVFPAGWKASPLLRAWLRRLAGLGVTLHARHRWIGWDEAGRPLVQSASGPMVVEADAVVLALGGASWPQLGSDGAWTDPFQRADIAVAPLRPANCGFIAPWSGVFRDRFEGQPLKNIALDFAGHVARGEVVVTRSGLEGGALYALASSLRPALDRQGAAIVHLSLRPDLAEADVAARLSGRRAKQSLATALRKTLRLAPVAIGLLREVEPALPQSLAAHDPAALAALINAVPLRFTAAMPIGRAISTAGGVDFTMLDAALMLRRRPGTFVAGEMLDWEAPTGGYLLQACFATGVAAGRGALAWAAARHGAAPAREAALTGGWEAPSPP